MHCITLHPNSGLQRRPKLPKVSGKLAIAIAKVGLFPLKYQVSLYHLLLACMLAALQSNKTTSVWEAYITVHNILTYVLFYKSLE